MIQIAESDGYFSVNDQGEVALDQTRALPQVSIGYQQGLDIDHCENISEAFRFGNRQFGIDTAANFGV